MRKFSRAPGAFISLAFRAEQDAGSMALAPALPPAQLSKGDRCIFKINISCSDQANYMVGPHFLEDISEIPQYLKSLLGSDFLRFTWHLWDSSWTCVAQSHSHFTSSRAPILLQDICSYLGATVKESSLDPLSQLSLDLLLFQLTYGFRCA